MGGELPAVAAGAGRGGLFVVILLLVSGAVGLRWARGESMPHLGDMKAAVKARVETSAPLFPPREQGDVTSSGPSLGAHVGTLRQHVVVAQPKGDEAGPRPEPDAPGPQVATDLLSSVLPYVTEGGVALLLGLGLGLATKAIARLFIFFIFLALLGVGYFAGQGVLAVDQVALVDWLRRFVLNAREHQDVVTALKAKIPAFGSLGVGYLLGLRR